MCIMQFYKKRKQVFDKLRKIYLYNNETNTNICIAVYQINLPVTVQICVVDDEYLN